MPERTVKRRLQDTGDALLASNNGPIFSTVVKLVIALDRAIPCLTTWSKRRKPYVSGVSCSAERDTKRATAAHAYLTGSRPHIPPRRVELFL
jgi:hypothetical protein